jgi:hypothetical protein
MPKSIESTMPLKCFIVSTRAKASTGVKPSTSPKTFATLKRIPMLKMILGLVGCDSNATTESTSIFLA